MSYSNGGSQATYGGGDSYSNGGSYSNGHSHSEVTTYSGGTMESSSTDMEVLIKSIKGSFDMYYPDKDPLGPICDRPLPFPKATPELIRWTNTFIDQISYKYTKEVKEIREINETLKRKVIEIEHKLKITVEENYRLIEENRCLREENEGYCIRIDILQDENRKLHLEIASLKVTIETLRKERSSLIKKIEVIEKQIEIYKKELSVVIFQLDICQKNLAESQHMWFLAIKMQHEVELTIRTKSEILARCEYERDSYDAKIKLLERQLELSYQRVEIGKETVIEWESRFSSKTVEITRLLEMWAGMDKQCKVSVHGKSHWELHHGFPKDLPGYIHEIVDCEPEKDPHKGYGHDHPKPEPPKVPGYGHDHPTPEPPKVPGYGHDHPKPEPPKVGPGYGNEPSEPEPPKEPSYGHEHPKPEPPKVPGYGTEPPKTGGGYPAGPPGSPTSSYGIPPAKMPLTPETPCDKHVHFGHGPDKKADYMPSTPVPGDKKSAPAPKKEEPKKTDTKK